MRTVKASPSIEVGQSPLTGNAATLSTGTLAVGTHYIWASYPGDAKNAAISSGVYVYAREGKSLRTVGAASGDRTHDILSHSQAFCR